MTLNDLRSQIAIVPQDCVLFNDTVKYNIAYGGVKDPEFKKMMEDPERDEELMEHIVRVAKKAQIHDFISSKEKKYDELVGERGLKLSGGEKQRVAIARALLKKTPIMCFDEATSSLDTQTEKEIQTAINEVSRDSTTLIIAHRLSTIRDCDWIIVLKMGQIMEEGTHEQLYEADGLYRKLWDRQSEQREREVKEKVEKELEEAERKRELEERMRKRRSTLLKHAGEESKESPGQTPSKN